MLIYITRKIAENIGIKCSEVRELCENDMVLIEPKGITLTLLELYNHPYYLELKSEIYS